MIGFSVIGSTRLDVKLESDASRPDFGQNREILDSVHTQTGRAV